MIRQLWRYDELLAHFLFRLVADSDARKTRQGPDMLGATFIAARGYR